MQQRRLLDRTELRAKGVTRSNTQLWRDVKDGKFPAPIKCGIRNLWVEAEVDAWIDARIAERDAAAPPPQSAAA